MKLKNIVFEFCKQVLPMFGFISLFIVIVRLGWGHFDNDWELVLLRAYISLTLWYYILYKPLLKFLKSTNNQKKFLIGMVILTPALYFLIDMVWSLIVNGKFRFLHALGVFVAMVIFLAIYCTATYFLQKVYYKRMNKKLQEYKNQDEPPPDGE